MTKINQLIAYASDPLPPSNTKLSQEKQVGPLEVIEEIRSGIMKTLSPKGSVGESLVEMDEFVLDELEDSFQIIKNNFERAFEKASVQDNENIKQMKKQYYVIDTTGGWGDILWGVVSALLPIANRKFMSLQELNERGIEKRLQCLEDVIEERKAWKVTSQKMLRKRLSVLQERQEHLATKNQCDIKVDYELERLKKINTKLFNKSL